MSLFFKVDKYFQDLHKQLLQYNLESKEMEKAKKGQVKFIVKRKVYWWWFVASTLPNIHPTSFLIDEFRSTSGFDNSLGLVFVLFKTRYSGEFHTQTFSSYLSLCLYFSLSSWRTLTFIVFKSNQISNFILQIPFWPQVLNLPLLEGLFSSLSFLTAGIRI